MHTSLLGHRWFHIWVPGVVVGIGGAFAYAYTKEPALLVVAALVLSLASVTAFGVFVRGRLRLGQVIGRNEVLAVALVGGVLSAALAYWVEGLGGILNSNYLTGPIEETAKLLVPLTLYILGRYRDPRAGLAIVLASAAGFGVIEATTHPIVSHVGHTASVGHSATDVGNPAFTFAIWQPLTEVFHPAVTGLIGAVAWRIWHRHGGFCVTWGVAAAVLGAMALHSGTDTLGALKGALGVLAFLPFLAVYVTFKFAARELTPPDAIAHVPPGWWPHWLTSRQGDRSIAGPGSPAMQEAAATD